MVYATFSRNLTSESLRFDHSSDVPFCNDTGLRERSLFRVLYHFRLMNRVLASENIGQPSFYYRLVKGGR